MNPNLSDLPGFPSSYIRFVEGATVPGQVLPDRPEKGPLLSRCRSALNRMPPPTVTPEIPGKETPIGHGSSLWSENIGKLESRSAAVVGASADAAEFSSSLAPLLRCLTAIKLADEISREGVPAVPLVWVGASAQAQEPGGESSGSIDPPPAARRHTGTLGLNLINHFNNHVEALTKKDLDFDSPRDVLRQLVREFGVILVGSASSRFTLAGRAELEDIWRKVARVCEGEPEPRAAQDKTERNPVAPGQVSDAVLFRLSMPVAVQVVGPEDYDTALLASSLVGSAGNPKPFLWPRVSATIVDRRSVRTMAKYKLELPDLLQRDVVLMERLERHRTTSDVSNRLEALAGSIRRRVDDVGVRAARDLRAARRIQTSGSKMLYQLRKLAVRSRQFADAHQDTALRQLEGLRDRVAPGGELQERSVSAFQFLSMYPGSVLQALFHKIDVWDFRHQLIAGLD